MTVSTVRLVCLMLAWYASSSIAILLSKGLLSDVIAGARFPFALALTATNNVVAGTVAALLVSGAPERKAGKGVEGFAWAIAATTALEIGLSNIALGMLTISMSTILKGMAPLCVMVWAIVLGLERVDARLISVMFVIVGGLLLAVAGGEGAFDARVLNRGLWAQGASALLSGLRWTLTQVFVKGDKVSSKSWIGSWFQVQSLERGLSSMETIRITAPYTLACITPFVVIFEGYDLVSWFLSADWQVICRTAALVSAIGFAVAALLYFEYELVRVTSSLTVSIGFVFKEVALIMLGIAVFSEKLSKSSLVGFAIVQGGIMAYAVVRSSRREEREFLPL